MHHISPPNLQRGVFFAKTAQNFYNMAKGYWRPQSKAKKVQIETQIQKSINILHAYGEYDSFKSYQQARVRQSRAERKQIMSGQQNLA